MARQFVAVPAVKIAGAPVHSSSPALPLAIFPVMPGVTLPHLSSGGLQTLPISTSAMAMLDASDVGPRTADQIVQAIRLACSRHGGEAQIKLDPEQFGDLSVSVKVEGNAVTARLSADAPAVREWLQANHASLRNALAGHDLRLDRLEVGAPEKSREAERDTEKRRQQAYDQPQKRSKRSDTGQVFEIVA
jgi:flagellar hook-length control protein FliK